MNVDTLSPEARMWGQPGKSYDGISFGLSDTISHTVQALWPRPGERSLDIGTGTGWAARLQLGVGASVTGVDIAPGMLEAAETLSAGVDPRPVFQQAAAEALPFRDESFDGVISTYGVIFSSEPFRAVAEMARVLGPVASGACDSWADDPDGEYIARFFGLVGEGSACAPATRLILRLRPALYLACQKIVEERFEIHLHEQVTRLIWIGCGDGLEANRSTSNFGTRARPHAPPCRKTGDRSYSERDVETSTDRWLTELGCWRYLGSVRSSCADVQAKSRLSRRCRGRQ